MIIARILADNELHLLTAQAEQFYNSLTLIATNGPFLPDRFNESIQLLSRNHMLIAVGLLDGDALKGALVGQIAGHWMADGKVAQELMWWVEPSARGSLESLRMIDLFEAEASSRGANLVLMATYHQADPGDRLPRVFAGLGYIPLEQHFSKIIRPWQ